MRFSLTLLPVVAAAALATSAAASGMPDNTVIGTTNQQQSNPTKGTVIGTTDQSKNSTSESALEKFLDDDGNHIDFTDEDGDPLGLDDDDEDAAANQRRSKKHTKHHKIAAKSKSSKYASSSPPAGSTSYQDPVQITWYASHDLKDPSCGTGDWNPQNTAHIGAVMSGWKSGPSCGAFVTLCNEDVSPHKCTTVRRIDSCAGCSENAIDLTKSAFKQLSPSGTLNEGRIHNIKMYHTKKANPWNLNLFGPFKLQL